MVKLSTAKRRAYEHYSPVFWKSSLQAEEKQSAFLAQQLSDASCICLVHEQDDQINGFIVAKLVAAPPVYDPGGSACVIDDFAVSVPQLWRSVGTSLKKEAEAKTKTLGAAVSVTVCGFHDKDKRNALDESGSRLTSEWYVREL